jgi:hypothetical protein
MATEFCHGTKDFSNHQTHHHFCDDLLAWKYFVEKSYDATLRHADCSAKG